MTCQPLQSKADPHHKFARRPAGVSDRQDADILGCNAEHFFHNRHTESSWLPLHPIVHSLEYERITLSLCIYEESGRQLVVDGCFKLFAATKKELAVTLQQHCILILGHHAPIRDHKPKSRFTKC